MQKTHSVSVQFVFVQRAGRNRSESLACFSTFTRSADIKALGKEVVANPDAVERNKPPDTKPTAPVTPNNIRREAKT